MRIVPSKTISVFFFMLCAALAGKAVAQPSAADIVTLHEKAYQTFADFNEQSLSLRLGYDHAAALVSVSHREQLLSLAEEADLKLKEIYDKQRQLRADIEAHDDDDWDKLYGVTGLWKSVYANEFETVWLRKEVAYYIALASGVRKRLDTADKIIGWCESEKNRFKNAQTKFLKAKASALIGTGSKGYKQHAMNIIAELADSQAHSEVYFRAMLLRGNIVGGINRVLLAEMAKEIEQSNFSEDFELNVRVAFAGLKAGETKYLEDVMAKWPGSEKLIAEIILDRLDHLEKNGALSDDLLVKQSVSEIVLALNAAVEKSPANYIGLLERLDRIEKFRCSLLSYALAETYVTDRAVLAVEHYIAAAAARNIDKTVSLTKLALAEKAFSIAVKLYNEDKKYCGVASRSVLFYSRAAGIEVDDETVGLYFEMLDECLSKPNVNKQLKRLAQSDGYFSDIVRFEVAQRKIKTDPTKQNYVNAIKTLAGAEHLCGYMRNADAMLYNISAQVDEYADESPAFIDDCYFLAKRFSDCRPADRQLEFVKIEFGIIAGADIAELSKELESIDGETLNAIKCKARLLQVKGDFAEAAAAWKKIYSLLQPNDDPMQAYSWWQGKYYELWCVSKLATTKKADISHAARVLESSYENIPPFWAKKLGEL